MATGLAIDSSDMDILVYGVFQKDRGSRSRSYLIDQMRRLHHQINNLSFIESNIMIDSATVPVIKIVSSLTLNSNLLICLTDSEYTLS